MRTLGTMSEVTVIVAVILVSAVIGVLAPPATDGVFAAIRHVLLWPLLVAPGWAICRAVFPPGRLTLTERAAISGAMALAVIVILGLCINALPQGLSSASWTWSLIGVTVVALVVGISTARFQGVGESHVSPHPVGLYVGFIAALTLMAIGLVIATHSADMHFRREHFTQLWALPGRSAWTVQYGVVNHEGHSQEYLLTIGRKNPSRPVRSFRFSLRSGEARARTLVLKQRSSRAVVVRLFRSRSARGKPILSANLVMKS